LKLKPHFTDFLKGWLSTQQKNYAYMTK